MKIRSSTKILVGFVLLACAIYFGYQFYARQVVANLKFDPVVPGQVSLVGIDPGAGYQVLVANDMAQLVEASGDFKSDDNNSKEGGSDSGSIKRRIPIKEMLGVFRGDSKSLGEFVGIMNDLRENEKWPTVFVVWTEEQLEKALNGDNALLNKLESDLNVKADGTPLPSLRPSTVENGIIVDYPVSLEVNINGKVQTVVGRVRQPYKPHILSIVEDKISNKTLTHEMMAGYYAEEAKTEMENPGAREDVVKSIRSIYSDQHKQMLRVAPEKVLRSATVVINENQIKEARYKSYESGPRKLHDLTIDLTDEGRQRLWKYSIDKVHSNLLLIVQGVAIAAPRIERPLTEQELTIRRMPDEVLVRDAVERMNSATKATQAK